MSPDDSEDEPLTLDALSPAARERVVWALLALLAVQIAAEPLLPAYAPQPAIVGIIVGGITTLIVMRRPRGL